MERLKHICEHLSLSSVEGLAPSLTSATVEEVPTKEQRISSIAALIENVPNKINDPEKQELRRAIPGPLDKYDLSEAFYHISESAFNGDMHLLFQRWSEEFANGGNIVIPFIVTPLRQMPYLDLIIVVCDEVDARDVARKHVRKSDLYGIAFLGNGVLSVRDIDNWKEQRQHLTEAFFPRASLSKIFPISSERALFSVKERLPMLMNEESVVEVNEFLLHEAMAQLQLALLGETEEFMDESNKPLREHFYNAIRPLRDPMEGMKLKSKSRRYIHQYSNQVLDRARAGEGREVVGASNALNDNKADVFGPLTARMVDNCPFGKEDRKLQRDTVGTFLFAGHDTTANLMTYFCYEMAHRPELQQRVQKEVDKMFAEIPEGRDLAYEDLNKLEFMQKAINEVLRLWPSVPNGTFREFQFADEITGRGGQKVRIPKETQCNIPVWMIHRNADLWGPDVNEFNPDREWNDEELWFGKTLATWAPESHRFCPFTFGPRNCIGQPFAQMEARVILSHIFHEYNLELAEPTKSIEDLNDHLQNIGTLGPKNGIYVKFTKRA